jgi:ferritin-like protein
MNPFQTLAQSGVGITQLLAAIVIAEATVISTMAYYLVVKTAPKWLFDKLIGNVEELEKNIVSGAKIDTISENIQVIRSIVERNK